jgi:prepilin-type N-terminal cleavage/methylation domain-containing protein/prepilin-type processing-associated H-X9-DG protein
VEGKSMSPVSHKSKRAAKSNSSAFTLIELLVVIAIIAILAAILFPVFGRARENARRSSCLSNTKQFGLSLQMYKQDYDETMILHSGGNGITQFWIYNLAPYVKNTQIAVCPSDTSPRSYPVPWDKGISYGMLRGAWSEYQTTYNALTMDSVVEWPSEYVILGDIGDKDGGGNNILGPTVTPSQEDAPLGADATSFRFNYRHMEGANFLYYDAHAKWQKKGTLKQKPNLLRNSTATTSLAGTYNG